MDYLFQHCAYLQGISLAPAQPNRQPAFEMRTQMRLEKISTAISLVGLSLGFSVLGLLIVAKEHDGGASITGGILGILLGGAFLIAACLYWKCGAQIQGGFQLEEVPAAQIASEMDKR
jgi:hypothetical protein